MSPWLSDRLLGSQSDERLVTLACAGSDRAFAAIVQRYHRPLYAFARQLNANGDADDLVQQTFMSALVAIRSGVEVRHLRGWLHQILRHASIRAARHEELPAELGAAEPATPSAQQTAELRLLALEALAALAQLPDRQQEAMVATAIHGRSRAEVAQLLGLSEGAVRQLVHRARETLRAGVTAITPYPLAQTLAAGPSAGGVADAVAGAGSAGVVALKVGALLASGVVATGVISSGIGGSSHRAHGDHTPSALRSAQASDPPVRPGGGTPLAQTSHGSQTASGHGPGTSGEHRGGGSDQSGSPGGSQTTSSDGDGGGGGGGGSGSSPGGPSATQASSTDGGGGTITTSGSDGGGGGTTTTSGSGGGGGSGSTDGGQITVTTATTSTSGSSDGGSSGGSGSGDTTTTSTTSGH